ncbi:hypothetical protein K440DRAFT_249782 [Wilcoxina mikolae CBS 423.85]|nr:hypothetical protein K440DRAFT_249782 [Wilcoxina mikolae CBS 423.85]
MGTAPRNNSSIDVQPGLDVVVEFPTGASIPEPPANAGQSSQSTIQTVNERYANIIFGANRLPNESGAEGCPIGPAADIVPDTKLEDQMEDPKRKSEQLLVKSTSTQTEQDDTYPDAKNTGGNADKKAAKKHQDEHFSGAPPFKTDREAADYYYNKYRDLKSENTRLTNSRAELTTENSSLKTGNKKLHAENGQLRDANKQFWQENTQLHAENQQLQRALKEERNRSSAATKKGDQLKEQLDDLYRSHIHSINSVNTGLDPISDRTFEEKFGSIHDEIHNWCRKAFKHQPKTEIRSAHELVPDLQEALDKRRYLAHSISLRFGHFVETVTWIVLEDWVLSRWFPGLKQNDQEHCVSLHNRVRGGGKYQNPGRRVPIPSSKIHHMYCRYFLNPRKSRVLARLHSVATFSESTSTEIPSGCAAGVG